MLNSGFVVWSAIEIDCVDGIISRELGIKDITVTERYASFLDLYLQMDRKGGFKTMHY